MRCETLSPVNSSKWNKRGKNETSWISIATQVKSTFKVARDSSGTVERIGSHKWTFLMYLMYQYYIPIRATYSAQTFQILVALPLQTLFCTSHNANAATRPANPANPIPAFTATAAPVCVGCALGVAEKSVEPAIDVIVIVLCSVLGTVIEPVGVSTAMLVLPVAAAKLVGLMVGPV